MWCGFDNFTLICSFIDFGSLILDKKWLKRGTSSHQKLWCMKRWDSNILTVLWWMICNWLKLRDLLVLINFCILFLIRIYQLQWQNHNQSLESLEHYLFLVIWQWQESKKCFFRLVHYLPLISFPLDRRNTKILMTKN